LYMCKCYLNNIIQNKNIAIEELCRKWNVHGCLAVLVQVLYMHTKKRRTRHSGVTQDYGIASA
jgi:hypothetical protein